MPLPSPWPPSRDCSLCWDGSPCLGASSRFGHVTRRQLCGFWSALLGDFRGLLSTFTDGWHLCSSRRQVQGAGGRSLLRLHYFFLLCVKASLFMEWTATGAAVPCVLCSLWGLVTESPRGDSPRQRCQDARLHCPPPRWQPGAATKPSVHHFFIWLLP